MNPGETILLRPRLVWVPWVFAVCLTGVVVGLGWGITGEWLGWVMIGLCAPPTALAGARLDPRCHQILLTHQGITVTQWFRAKQHEWNQVSEIQVARFGVGKVVRLVFAPGLGSAVLLTGDWQMSADALAVLIRRWQHRVLERDQSGFAKL